MTREERQTQAEARARKALARRRQQVGRLAEQAGLLAWDDATLAGLFQALALLRETPEPVAVLEGLLTGEVVHWRQAHMRWEDRG
jgi:hypothetical protein